MLDFSVKACDDKDRLDEWLATQGESSNGRESEKKIVSDAKRTILV